MGPMMVPFQLIIITSSSAKDGIGDEEVSDGGRLERAGRRGFDSRGDPTDGDAPRSARP